MPTGAGTARSVPGCRETRQQAARKQRPGGHEKQGGQVGRDLDLLWQQAQTVAHPKGTMPWLASGQGTVLFVLQDWFNVGVLRDNKQYIYATMDQAIEASRGRGCLQPPPQQQLP